MKNFKSQIHELDTEEKFTNESNEFTSLVKF